MTNKLRFGILGVGWIAQEFARGLNKSEKCELVAVAGMENQSLDYIKESFTAQKYYLGFEKLLADPDIDAVYIAVPNPFHCEWAIKAANAKKHVLCEKPMAMNLEQAEKMIEAAKVNEVFFMEGFMYRCHPQTQKLIDLLRSHKIGDVKTIEATLSFEAPDDTNSRLINKALGGGGILDVGGYCASITRLIAGAAVDLNYDNPIEVKAVGYIGNTGVDDYTTALLKFKSNIIARLSVGVRVKQDMGVKIYGTKGWIFVREPWFSGETSEIKTKLYENDIEETILVENKESVYMLEANVMADNIANKQAAYPAMSWEDSLETIKVLDAWKKEIGLEY